MKAVILAGGEGTRLHPLTCNKVKSLVPVLNRPFLEHLIDHLKRHGITDIILTLGHLPEQIQEYFGDGSGFGVSMTYLVEDCPLGTAGGVKNAEALLEAPFLVFNGDIFSDIDLTDMMNCHRENRAAASIALTPVDDPTAYGVVETSAEGRVKRFVEKPRREEVTTNMINAGVYIMEPHVLDYIARNVFFTFERDVFPSLLERGEAVYGYPSQAYWLDIGTPDKYLKLHHDLLQRCTADSVTRLEGEGFAHSSARIEGPVVIGEGCSVGKGCTIRGPAVLGPQCRIEEGTVIEGAVLWQDCRIGEKAKLRNCVLASRCHIGEESEVLHGCVLGDDVIIGKGNRLSNGIRIWPNKAIEPDAISF
jgi:mannose-1-phosphate guanylyltransferase